MAKIKDRRKNLKNDTQDFFDDEKQFYRRR